MMKRAVLVIVTIIAVVAAWPTLRAMALPSSPGDPTRPLHFTSPYDSSRPLDSFLVFTAPPRADVPDGQIHWTAQEVPGIDTLGPDGNLYNMCPDGGLAWTLQGGDPFGGGTFVAVECEGRATDWQLLAFHLCEVKIQYSIQASNRVYTRVPAGGLLGGECPNGHSHLSLGYWADEGAKRPLPCPQWHVQGRYWVNAACLLNTSGLPQTAPFHLTFADDWELRYLTPQILDPLRRGALLALLIGLMLYLAFGFLQIFRPPAEGAPPKLQFNAFPEAILKSGIWVSGVFMLILLSAGPVWPVGGYAPSGYTTEAEPYKAMAQAVGYGDWELLRAFYIVAVPRGADGQPVSGDTPGRVFPPEAAAAIPFGETNAEAWVEVDPTQPGPYGQYRAWEAVVDRWPVSFYERFFLGRDISQEAQHQREGLSAIVASPDMLALGQKLGKTIRAEDLYGSSAGAVGRTQILPGHFAPGALCGEAATMDVWNNRLAIAECTTRYLSQSGCWGSWYANGDVWSALCGYNPGAWNSERDAWYWDVLQDRMTMLTVAATQARLRISTPGPTPSVGADHHVSTPVLGLLVTEALLQNGDSAYGLPDPWRGWVASAAPGLEPYRSQVRGLYRIFRAWTLIYYAPTDLLKMGIQL